MICQAGAWPWSETTPAEALSITRENLERNCEAPHQTPSSSQRTSVRLQFQCYSWATLCPTNCFCIYQEKQPVKYIFSQSRSLLILGHKKYLQLCEVSEIILNDRRTCKIINDWGLRKKDSKNDSVFLIIIWHYLVIWTTFYWISNKSNKSLST